MAIKKTLRGTCNTQPIKLIVSAYGHVKLLVSHFGCTIICSMLSGGNGIFGNMAAGYNLSESYLYGAGYTGSIVGRFVIKCCFGLKHFLHPKQIIHLLI